MCLGDVDHETFNSDSKTQHENYDWILIDDDKYIRYSWIYYAKNAKKILKTYSNVSDFFIDANSVNKDCTIYLDLNIDGEKTTKYISEINKLGFTRVYLATGENDISNNLPPGFLGVTGKLPPVYQ